MDAALLAEAASYLGHWLDHRRRSLRIPGLVAAVARDGELLLHHAYGTADLATGEPMTTEHVFPVASHSKTFATVLVLKLAEQGRLRLDDRLGRFLPELTGAAAGIRVRDLLSHSAGISRDGPEADHWQLKRPFPGAQELPALAEQVLPRHQRFKYSNIGFALLGRVVEEATAQSYAGLLRDEVLDPLGLADTEPDVLPGRRYATGYSSRRGGRRREPLGLVPTSALAPATGVCSSAADLVRFATALCDGVPSLLDEDSRREMRRVAWAGENGDQDYGLGLTSTLVDERRVHGHGGAFPGFISATRVDVHERLVVVVLANAIDAPSAELTLTMQRLLGFAARGPGGAPPAGGVPGRYSGLWSTVDVVPLGSRLVALDPELADPIDRRVSWSPTPAIRPPCASRAAAGSAALASASCSGPTTCGSPGSGWSWSSAGDAAH